MDRNDTAAHIDAAPHVALRKESVDRNGLSVAQRCRIVVALRKESVDRNLQALQVAAEVGRRSPQGERG